MSPIFDQIFSQEAVGLSEHIPALRRVDFLAEVKKRVEARLEAAATQNSDNETIRHLIQTESPLVGTALLMSALVEAGLSASSPRSRMAVSNLQSDFSNADECLKTAVQLEGVARAMWLERAVDPWCDRHNITRQQAMSVLFEDGSFNEANPEVDLVTKESILNWGGQQNDFYIQTANELKTSRPFTVLASFARTGELRSYLTYAKDAESAFEAVAADNADVPLEFLACLNGHQKADRHFDFPGEAITQITEVLGRMESRDVARATSRPK